MCWFVFWCANIGPYFIRVSSSSLMSSNIDSICHITTLEFLFIRKSNSFKCLAVFSSCLTSHILMAAGSIKVSPTVWGFLFFQLNVKSKMGLEVPLWKYRLVFRRRSGVSWHLSIIELQWLILVKCLCRFLAAQYPTVTYTSYTPWIEAGRWILA